jgi:hypothetical protein
MVFRDKTTLRSNTLTCCSTSQARAVNKVLFHTCIRSEKRLLRGYWQIRPRQYSYPIFGVCGLRDNFSATTVVNVVIMSWKRKINARHVNKLNIRKLSMILASRKKVGRRKVRVMLSFTLRVWRNMGLRTCPFLISCSWTVPMYWTTWNIFGKSPEKFPLNNNWLILIVRTFISAISPNYTQ